MLKLKKDEAKFFAFKMNKKSRKFEKTCKIFTKNKRKSRTLAENEISA